ncbi:hypothetical protein MMC18_008698 [Xylographa bjoerkii]|nr:hypothetical protein [Xylographa bjoerkii]
MNKTKKRPLSECTTEPLTKKARTYRLDRKTLNEQQSLLSAQACVSSLTSTVGTSTGWEFLMGDQTLPDRGRSASPSKRDWDTAQTSSAPSTTTRTSQRSVKIPVPPSKRGSKSQTGSPKKTFTELPAAVIPILTLDLRGSATKPIPSVITKLRDELLSGLETGYIPESCQRELSVVDPAEYSTITPQMQTQTIAVEYLTTIKDNTVERKADYALGFNPSDPEVEEIFDMSIKLKQPMSHMADVYTMHTVMVAGFEVKSKDGSESEALVQIQTWSAALHSDMHQIIEKALHIRAAENLIPNEIQVMAMPTIGCLVIGHNWQFYIMARMPSVRSVKQGGVPQVICVPVPQLEASTKTFRGVFKLIKILGRISAWAEQTYWPWLKKEVLDSLE